MPQIDKELKSKGYIPVLARLIYKAASQRREGYLEAVTSKAVIRDGVFYLSKEDYENIRTEYNDNPPNRKIETTTVSALESDIAKFLDDSQPCPRAEWYSLRSLYVNELASRKQAGCTNCQLNSIKRKYKSMLLDNNYE